MPEEVDVGQLRDRAVERRWDAIERGDEPWPLLTKNAGVMRRRRVEDANLQRSY
jgi:hypothetical protein